MSSVVVYNNVHFKDCVIDGTHYIKWSLKQIYSTQQRLFRHANEYSSKAIPYTNNYYMCVDTIFRLTSLTLTLMKKLTKTYGVERFTFVVDGRDWTDALHALTPKWRELQYYREFKSPLNKEYSYRSLSARLVALSKYLTDEELETYKCYERFITKSYSWLPHVSITSRIPYYTFPKIRRIVAKNRFFGMLQLVQAEITEAEWLFILNAFFAQMNLFDNVEVLICHNNIFGSAFEVAISKCKDNAQVLTVLNKAPSYVGLYNYTLSDGHLYRTSRKRRIVSLNVPYTSKASPKLATLLELYDLCEEEMEYSIINTNPYNVYNVFVDVQQLYGNGDADTPSQTYESPVKTLFTNMILDKECVANALRDFVGAYNAKYGTAFAL